MDGARRLGLVTVALSIAACQDVLQDSPGGLPDTAADGADEGDEVDDPQRGACPGIPGQEPGPEGVWSREYELAGVAAKCALQTTPEGPEPPEPEPDLPPGPPPLPLFVEGSTTFVVLPDTQYYSLRFPGVFNSQTKWIARNAVDRNIAYAFHLGDLVQYNKESEWKRASAAMAELDGIVPYGVVPGNHDYGPSGDASTRETLLNQWFSFDDAELMPSFGGSYEPGKLDNTFHLFDAGGHSWVALLLEWGPRDGVVEWANDVMGLYPERLGILVTHAYLNHDDRRYDHTDDAHSQAYNPHHYDTMGGVNDGEELWQKLVRQHRFVLTLNGHVLGDGAGYLASVNDHGQVVHQMLSNYQHRPMGGEGFLRLLELEPDGRTMHVRTYSPWYDEYLTAADQNFTIELDVG
ncbi:metallophosphoesterase [Nannocystis punicea]|uniref:Calcineurin-like phosphoesterase domain-containing protein n=1 Tax=Nannocystis punicea TaxID=2995304 RepID=A0ABY7GW97_9BACT|nr:metallophosphoesterase [Nannocystis poenicansa]WAS91180.1 hypothetical protein O0S08_33755 [Nannocystis poenicansa]